MKILIIGSSGLIGTVRWDRARLGGELLQGSGDKEHGRHGHTGAQKPSSKSHVDPPRSWNTLLSTVKYPRDYPGAGHPVKQKTT